MVRQAGLVLWRTLYIQALRRHWLATTLEVLLVTVCFAQLRHHTSPKDKNYAGFNPAVTYPARALSEIVSEGVSIGGRTVCYGPSTKYAQLLMDSAYPRREQHDLRDSDATSTTFDHVYVDKDAEVRSACQELSRRERAHIVPCLRFHGDETALNYSVYVYADEQITANDLAFRVPLVFKPPGEPSKLLTHIFSTLARVNLAHIRFMSNNTEDLPMQFQFRRFPHPSLPKDMPNYASVVGLILMIGFLVPFCLRVQAMVQENANGLKEVQRLMGLSDASYWTGHFFSHLFLALLESGCAVLCVLLLTGPDSEEALLEGVNPWLLILSFFLFSVLFSLHVLLVACFFTNGKCSVLLPFPPEACLTRLCLRSLGVR
ncbi:hypothetical protein HPB50_010143 [Hyalomma asiaticum]|uniref:Uncharacterized protein n=1 Tax=Hyalomma asiaticum TaxID=266040 RepID=A0ACB7SDM6_HYAAI|nr:hypothetical protein HPB50_010143 [Hyalomma asiaticum]